VLDAPTTVSRRFTRAAAAIALASLVALFAGCAATSDQRPAPEQTVMSYLEAISSGDASAARAFETDVEQNGEYTELDTLRTDAVLQGATTRISDITIGNVGRSTLPDGTTHSQVSFSFHLGAKQYDSSLGVVWNEKAGEWRLSDDLAIKVSVTAEVSSTKVALVGFDFAGTKVQPSDPATGTLFYLAYPGVYPVSVDVPSELLVDPSAGTTREVTVVPGADVSVDIPVTQLPPTN
jgi:hypothetical protein